MQSLHQSQYQPKKGKHKRNKTNNRHTVNRLPILPLLLIEYRVLVFRQHFLLTRHLVVPSLHGFSRYPVPRKCRADGVDDAIDGAETLALPRFLRLRDSPGSFPVCRGG